MPGANRYSRIIEWIFDLRYVDGADTVDFDRGDIVAAASALGINLPKNIGDVIYSFRYRATLPESVTLRSPAGRSWIIRPNGRARYRFVASTLASVRPNMLMVETKVPDATPGLIQMYALTDEQALLAKLRYNRLIDIFTGVTCYSLQNHLRTSIPGIGQVETDEIYVGLDRRGSHYVIPVQAKGGHDSINIVQIEQDLALCASRFRTLICRPIAAQFLRDDLIALFEFEDTDVGVAIAAEKHYRLVASEELTPEDLASYRSRP